MRFSAQGHDVHVLDNYLRRNAHRANRTDSLTPIAADLATRVSVWEKVSGRRIECTEGDLTSWDLVVELFDEFRPDVIVHYGEQPSAPYSMASRDRCVQTQV